MLTRRHLQLVSGASGGGAFHERRVPVVTSDHEPHLNSAGGVASVCLMVLTLPSWCSTCSLCHRGALRARFAVVGVLCFDYCSSSTTSRVLP